MLRPEPEILPALGALLAPAPLAALTPGRGRVPLPAATTPPASGSAPPAIPAAAADLGHQPLGTSARYRALRALLAP